MNFKKDAQANTIIRCLKKLNASLFASFAVIFIFWLILLSTKKYDGDVLFTNLFYYAFTTENIKGILKIFAPFLIGSIAVLICFRVGFINLGVAGQMSASGLTIFLIANQLQKAQLNNDYWLWFVLLTLIGMLVAGLIAVFCAGLKVYFGISEILTTIMLNYFIFYLFRYVIGHPDITSVIGRLQTKTEINHFMGFNIFIAFLPVSAFFALLLFTVLCFIFEKTLYGFKLKIIGKNPRAGSYAGINYQRHVLFLVFVSGLLAGLAGVFYYYRSFDNNYLFLSEALPFNGFDTISIVWLAQSSFLALPFVTFFVALLRHQQQTIASSDLPELSVEIILGFVLFAVALTNRLLTMDESEKAELKSKLTTKYPGIFYHWNRLRHFFKTKKTQKLEKTK